MANKTLMPHKHLYYYHALERPCSHVNSSFYDLSTFERGTCRKKGALPMIHAKIPPFDLSVPKKILIKSSSVVLS